MFTRRLGIVLQQGCHSHRSIRQSSTLVVNVCLFATNLPCFSAVLVRNVYLAVNRIFLSRSSSKYCWYFSLPLLSSCLIIRMAFLLPYAIRCCRRCSSFFLSLFLSLTLSFSFASFLPFAKPFTDRNSHTLAHSLHSLLIIVCCVWRLNSNDCAKKKKGRCLFTFKT